MSDATKRCTKCQEPKPIDSFGLNKRSKDGHKTICRKCLASQTRERRSSRPRRASQSKAAQAAYYEANKEAYAAGIRRRRDTDPDKFSRMIRGHRLKRYGLTLETWEEILAEQGGVCAICRQEPSRTGQNTQRLQVDHCHSTGRVRGLLCLRCNSLLGHARDDQTILAAAIIYLRRST